MDFAAFFKKQWVLLLNVAALLVLFLTDIVKPPNISNSLSAANLNIINIAKFIVLGVLLILMLPIEMFKEKKFAFWYWLFSIVFFCLSLACLWIYSNNYSKYTAYNSFKNQQLIIGNKYMPEAQNAIDSIKRSNKDIVVTPRMMLEGYGEPEDLWFPADIESNARSLVIHYLLIVLFGAVFLILAMQALKCSTTV